MSNIDKRALRVLATALDGDDWHAEGNSVYGGRYDVGDNVCYDHIASCESVNGKSPHADFIAAANPATVLALLDELEAKDKQIADLKEAFSIALSAAGIDSPAAAGKGEASWKLSPLAGLTNAVATTNPTRSKLLAGMKPPCGMTIA